MHLQLVHALIPLIFWPVQANVTVYGTLGTYGSSSTMTATATMTSPSAPADRIVYNPVALRAPPIPIPRPATSFNIQLNNGGMQGLSIPLPSGFLGFSVEMSVIDQVLGRNSSLIQVPFLNLMANLVDRGGSVKVRVGGNSQDTAELVNEIPNGADLSTDETAISVPSHTSTLNFNEDLMYAMANISNLVGVKWYFGIPFGNGQKFNLKVAEVAQEILGGNLIGLQVGNEPDLYVDRGHRPVGYGALDYVTEFGRLVSELGNDINIRNRSMLIGPNLAGGWTLEDFWATGFVRTYASSLTALAVERYPIDNCAAQTRTTQPADTQEPVDTFLTHRLGQSIVAPYLPSTQYAQTMLRPFLMFQTNLASCVGFADIGDSFGAALWGVDYALQMAYGNFSGALFHVGGQGDFYSPFTPPPNNQSSFHQWTIGPIYYSALAVAETLGSSSKSRVVDLNANTGNEFTPGYAVYEGDSPVRVALFNFVNDGSGASDYTATISIEGSALGQVKVKYLLPGVVGSKDQYRWANQTFGAPLSSDGRLMGQQTIQTVTCNNGMCPVKVPAPSFALVFLSDSALSESNNGASQTFSTSFRTKTENTATVDPAVLATSNGHRSIPKHGLGGTSKGEGHGNAASGLSQGLPSIVALVSLVVGSLLVT